MSESIFEISPSVTLVTSFDFDGCSDRDFSQEALINHIADESKKIQGLKKIIVMIGSLRQSLKLDILNAGHNSAYPNYISCSSLMDN